MTGVSQEREAQIACFFQKLADAFMSGDHEWLAGIYIYPLVVYIHGDIFLERTPAETLQNLFERRQTALRAGTSAIVSHLVAVGDGDAGRFPVRVNWDFLRSDGAIVAQNELRYFCRFDENGQPRIEILEFIKRGFPTSPEPDRNIRH